MSASVPSTEARDARIPLGALRDTLALVRRNLYAYLRVPQLLVFSTIQPVIFVLMFRYVFGGAIRLEGPVDYVDFLMPGIFVQTVTFGSTAAAVGLATDLKSGLMERFHALPMSRAAVLAGRTGADLVRNLFVVALMMVVGYLVGWRVHTDALGLIGAAGLVLAFGYALSWVFATLGLAVGDPEAAQAAAFPVLAPLVFASAAFVPLETMPGWLQAFARNQPVSLTAEAARALTVGGEAASLVLRALAWDAGILLVFGAIAVRLYRRTT
ncbi:MAG: transport permease protein [Actinomycetota bacterium]|nr:MAG: transport permease protein [Actinomycetota bacterium]